jgi:acetylornithine deacetylase/succinyl-diaminopimelate desuccinylase-like protein
MYMGHMDVVPANADDWTVDPFSGELRDGYVWGRGSLDMLSILAAQAVAFAESVRERGPFAGDFAFLAVADEEAAGRYGARWLVENHWDWVKTDNMVTELGGFPLAQGRPALTVGEKGVAWARLSFTGTAAHGSIPYRADNALEKLTLAATRLRKLRPSIRLSPLVRSMAGTMMTSGWDRFLAGNPLTLDLALSRLHRTNPGAAKVLHTASRMSVSPNVIRSGRKLNIVPDYGELELDIRVLPGQTVEYVQEEIFSSLGPLAKEARLEFIDYFPSNTSPTDTALYGALESVTEGVVPGSKLAPLFLGGVTDGRFWRQRGSTVYGYTLFDDEMTMTDFNRRVHGADERVSVAGLERALRAFYELPSVFYSGGSSGL